MTQRVRMRAGQLRDRVMIQKPIETRDARGGVVIAYEDVEVRPASIESLASGERVAAAQVEGVGTCTITMRACGWLTMRHRLVDVITARTYDIAGIPIPRSTDGFTVIDARERPDGS